jgi:hypothetical protein
MVYSYTKANGDGEDEPPPDVVDDEHYTILP